MKLPLPMLLLGLCLAVGTAVPAQAREAQHKVHAAKSGATATKARTKQRLSSARAAQLRKVALVAAVPARPSFGQIQGLHAGGDALDLKSSVALVIDQDTNEVLFSKNSSAVLPIASITKLMTGLVVAEAKQPLDEVLTITQDDIDTEKGSRSRLAVGTQLSRGEMMHLALMSSENRAANALGRHYPGGLEAAVA
ncbi:MAG: peptidase S11, partial [Burkholderiales bacterium PBB5]